MPLKHEKPLKFSRYIRFDFDCLAEEMGILKCHHAYLQEQYFRSFLYFNYRNILQNVELFLMHESKNIRNHLFCYEVLL